MGETADLVQALGQRGPVMVQPADESSDDSRLVDAARAGDRGAFGRLYERYGRVVHGILLSRVPPGEVADLVQDVFLLAMRRLHTLREPAAFGGWLVAIARNRANDFHRRSPTLEELDEEMASKNQEEAEARAASSISHKCAASLASGCIHPRAAPQDLVPTEGIAQGLG